MKSLATGALSRISRVSLLTVHVPGCLCLQLYFLLPTARTSQNLHLGLGFRGEQSGTGRSHFSLKFCHCFGRGSDAFRIWFGCGSDVVRMWFGRGLDAVWMWFRGGSDVFSDLVQTVWQKLRESGFQRQGQTLEGGYAPSELRAPKSRDSLRLWRQFLPLPRKMGVQKKGSFGKGVFSEGPFSRDSRESRES